MKDWFRRHTPSPSFQPATETPQQVPDDLWVRCDRCGELTYRREIENNLWVCVKCSHHFRVSARQRIAQLADAGSFAEHFAHLLPADPLGFASDGARYAERMRKEQRKTGSNEAVVVGTAAVEGSPTVLVVNEFAFLAATMGSVYGEKLARAVDLALERRLPVVTVSASGGARMHEGTFSLMQMAKTTTAFARLGRARLPHISLLTDPCTGGVTASYATSADVLVAEPGALIGFAGPRVIEQTTRQKLPAGFQSAEFCLEHGMIDMVTPRRELRSVIGRTLRVLAPTGPVA